MPNWLHNWFSFSILALGALILLALGGAAGLWLDLPWAIIVTAVLCLGGIWLGGQLWSGSGGMVSWTIPICLLLVIGFVVGALLRWLT